MKRFLLVAVAALAAVLLFTACPDKPDDGILFYQEDISLYLPLFDTTIYYTQEFKKVDNDIIYDPCSEANANGYINFKYYCPTYGYDITRPMVYIENDTIYYDALFSHGHIANIRGRKAKIEWQGKDFAFSYVFEDNGSIATHNCHRIKSLSN